MTDRHHRMLYWCWIINEPGLVRYEGNTPRCTTCGGALSNEEDPMHEAIIRVESPKRGFRLMEAPKEERKPEYNLVPSTPSIEAKRGPEVCDRFTPTGVTSTTCVYCGHTFEAHERAITRS